jgi:hypothetical protein
MTVRMNASISDHYAYMPIQKLPSLSADPPLLYSFIGSLEGKYEPDPIHFRSPHGVSVIDDNVESTSIVDVCTVQKLHLPNPRTVRGLRPS